MAFLDLFRRALFRLAYEFLRLLTALFPVTHGSSLLSVSIGTGVKPAGEKTWSCLLAQEAQDRVFPMLQSLIVPSVVHPVPSLLRANEPRRLHDAQVLGHRRMGHTKPGRQGVHAERMVLKQLENADPRINGQGFAQLGQFVRGYWIVHGLNPSRRGYEGGASVCKHVQKY
jgi:hypothetical protein